MGFRATLNSFRKFKVALNPMHRICLDFAKSCISFCLSKFHNKKKLHRAEIIPSHLARSGLPAVFRKQSYNESPIINPLLTKFARSRWLDIGLVLFFASLWTSTSSPSLNIHVQYTQKRPWAISSHLDLTLGQ